MIALALGIGLVLVIAGGLAVRNPRLGEMRDAKLVTSDEVGAGERAAGIAIGLIVILIGVAFLFLGLKY